MGKLLPFPEESDLHTQANNLREDLPIEAYLHTAAGQAQMEDLISGMESSQDLTKKLHAMLKDAIHDSGHIVALLLSPVGTEGLNDKSLVKPFQQNPAMNRTLGFIRRAKYDGGDTMVRLYSDLLTILANVTRYEVLEDTYDPESTRWHSRAAKIYYYRHGNYTQYLPDRLNTTKND
jgi:hypothetical protein